MRFSKKSLLACSALVLCAGAANAQSVDYNMLQQTFGEPVTMSATGKPQRASDVPADMIIITQDQIRRSGATKLMDVMKFVPGLDVRTYGDNDAEVNVQGYIQPANPHKLLQLDGRLVYLDHHGYVDWNTLPVQLTDIQQIEVVKGPGSSLFGFNAYSGVINIITRNPQHVNEAILQATYGSYGTQNYSGVVSYNPLDDLAIKATGGYSTQSPYNVDLTVPGSVPADRPKSIDASLQVRWQAMDKLQVIGEGTWAKSHQYELSAIGGFTNMSYNTYYYKTGVLADTDYGLFDVSAYRNHMRHVIELWGMHAIWFNDVTVVSASDLFKIGNDVTVRVAGEYRDNMSTTTGTGTTTKVAERVYAVSGMVDWAITPELSFTNSGRIDWLQPRFYGTAATNNGRTIDNYSFNSGLVWKATDQDTIRFLAGRSIQAPSLLLFWNNPQIDPSALTSLELTYDRAVSEIFTNFHMAVYRHWYNRMLEDAAVNVGNSSSWGFEATFNGQTEDRWRWNGSLNARSTKDALTFVPGFFNGYAIDFEATNPKYIATLGVGKTIGDFEIDFAGKWTSKAKDWYPTLFSTSFVDVPAHFTMNVRVGWKISDNFTLAVTAEQFNQETVYEGSYYPDKRRILVTLTASL